MRALREQRRAIARIRVTVAAENDERLRALRAQLALLADILTLLFERSAAAVVDDAVLEEIDHAVAEAEEADSLVRELASLKDPAVALPA